MPKINTIAIVPVPKLSDKLVGTSVGGTPVNQTNNFTLQQLKTLFDGAPVSPNLQAVLNAGNTATQNIYLTGTIDTVNLDVSNDSFLKNLYLSERLFDRNNFQGTSGQYLTSTGTGVQWSTLTIATPTLQQVLTAGNISDKNIITTGNIQAANIEGTNITANTNLRVVGTLSDSSNSVGGSGQVLSSTVTGTDWIDFPSYSAVSPLIYNNVLKQFSIQVATSTQNGYLSSADWITFNGKQNAGNYITALTGEASALGPGSVNITLNNLAVINKTLTGLAISSGVITAADSIITAFGKIQGQINGIVAGVVYQGVWNAATNTPTLTSSVGVQGHYYVVDVAGNTNLNGITDWQVGDWAIYNGTAWQKVDNTDSVTSVNGQTGIVVLNSDNIAEGTTNLYYLDSRARAAISSVATGLTYTSATGVFSLTAGYSIPTVANQTNWTTAYNDSIVSAAVTGTTTKTLTLTQQDGGTITASWTDIDTNLVTSVFGRTGAVVAQAGDYSTTLVTEGTNLYYLDSRARSAISSSATGLTYTTATGVFSFTAGYSIPTDASQSNWTTAYNDSITSAAVTGTTTKTLTLNQQDGGTITASWTDLDTGLTSVGVSMPSAFNVTNSPLTSNGTIAVTGAGTASQYVRGDGTLGDFPTGGGGGGASVSYYLNGSINQGTFGGNTYYQMSKTPILGAGTDFITSTNGYIAQFITDVGTPDALLIPGGNWNFETYFSASSGGGSPTFYIELYKYDGATFTLIASNSSNPELIAFGTTINPYYNSLAVPETILLATDRLAIRIYVFTSGRTITLHTEDNHLCQAITTFTTGLTALNGLTKQIQYFAVGTSGTDFNISSSVATHTFNLPTASATNRGALSSSDWSTFNGKQNALTLTTSGSSGPATLIGATLNIPDYGSALSGYVPYTGASQAVNLGIYSLSAGSLFVNGPAPTSGSYLGFKQATSVTTGGGGYTSISTFGTSQMNFSFAQPSGFKEFKFDVSSITTGVPGGRVYTMPDADGTIALVGGSGVGTVTSVAALTLGTSGTDLSSTVANSTTTPVITLNVPTASATNRGALSSADWSTFNNKQNTITLTTTGTSGAATLVGSTLNIPQYQSVLTNPITGTGTTNYLPKFTGSTTVGNSQVFDNGSGVGIGGTNTDSLLTINGTAGTTHERFREGSTTIGFIGGANGLITGQNGKLAVRAEAGLVLSSQGNSPDVLITSGNLLVGTTTDNGARLNLNGSQYIRGGNELRFYRTDNAIYTQLYDAGSTFALDNRNGNGFSFQSAGTNQMVITSSGNVLIGTTTNATGSPIFYIQNKNGLIANIAGFNFSTTSTGDNSNNNLLSSGSYYSGSAVIATQTTASIYQQYAGEHLFYTNSGLTVGNSYSATERMRITSTGNVGIGYTSPTYQLQVLNTIGLRANGTSFQAIKGTYWGYSTSYPVVMLGDSNTANFTTVSIGYDPSANANGAFSGDGREVLFRRGAQFVTPNAANNAFNLYNLVLLDGNVGIGTSSPGYRLVVNSATDGISAGISGNTYGIRFDNGGTFSSGMSTIHGVDNTLVGSYQPIMLNGLDVRFGTSANERMRITSGGNVGIGTSSPSYILDVHTNNSVYNTRFYQPSSSTSAYNALLITGAMTSAIGYMGIGGSATGNTSFRDTFVIGTQSNHPLVFNTNDSERMRITSSGNLLIGTTTDVGATLYVNGTIRTGTLTAGTQTTAVDWRLGNARGGAATNNALIRVQINGVLVDLLGNYV
jgi:hypothetical protein